MTTQNPFDVPEFRAELTKLLDDKLTPLVNKVDDHEKTLERVKGVGWVLAALWAGLEFVFHIPVGRGGH